jgi:hypothetical protein
MKIFLIILFQIALSQLCTKTTYGKNGTYCDGDTKRCKIYSTCSKENLCKNSDINDPCQEDTDCFLSKEKNIKCINNKCIRPKYNGFECFSNEECFSNFCSNNYCSSKDLNSCNPESFNGCDEGFFCSKQGHCTESLLQNQNCSNVFFNSDIKPILQLDGSNFMSVCKPGFICLGTNNSDQKCVPYRNAKINEKCNFERNSHLECDWGN